MSTLRLFKNKQTGEIKKSFKILESTKWDEIRVAPGQVYNELACKVENRHRPRGMDKCMIQRSREHSRDVMCDKNVYLARKNGLDELVDRQFLNDKGEKRRKIDDV